jgi:hypothetical protein
MTDEIEVQEEKKNEYVMLPLKPATKERLYKLKNMNESWDDVMNRVIDKAVVSDGQPIQ